jgi:hypothetical protein
MAHVLSIQLPLPSPGVICHTKQDTRVLRLVVLPHGFLAIWAAERVVVAILSVSKARPPTGLHQTALLAVVWQALTLAVQDSSAMGETTAETAHSMIGWSRSTYGSLHEPSGH